MADFRSKWPALSAGFCAFGGDVSDVPTQPDPEPEPEPADTPDDMPEEDDEADEDEAD